jgi:hypothetical protein
VTLECVDAFIALGAEPNNAAFATVVSVASAAQLPIHKYF